jgi:hypothetical protein
MKSITKAAFGFLALGWPLFGQSAQSLILPDVVDGAGWRSTIVLTNTTATLAAASLIFHMEDTTGGGTQPWTPPFLDTSSTTGISLTGGSSLFLHTPGTAGALAQGWAEVHADDGIVAYVIFTHSVPGSPDQDATAPAVAAASRILVPFDNASGSATAIAVVNPTATAESIFVTYRTSNGTVTARSLPSVPPLGHMAFFLPQLFPGMSGQNGLAEFYSASGNFSLIALRFNATSSSTAAPVYFQTGPPVIYDPNVTYPPDYYYSYQADQSAK